MVPLKKEVSLSLGKFLDFVFPKKEKYLNEKTIFYLRLYTDLIRAEDRLNPNQNKAMVNILKVVRNMARSTEFREEEAYLKRIRDIASEILGNFNKIKIQIKKDPAGDPMHAKTKLQLAQNICILRIIKRSAK